MNFQALVKQKKNSKKGSRKITTKTMYTQLLNIRVLENLKNNPMKIS